MLAEISQFMHEKLKEGERFMGSSPLQTWELYRQGKSIEAIAEARGYADMTIMGHLASMYERGEDLDILEWVSPEAWEIIHGALPLFEEPYQMKLIFEHFKEQYSYDAIRFALAAQKRQSLGFKID